MQRKPIRAIAIGLATGVGIVGIDRDVLAKPLGAHTISRDSALDQRLHHGLGARL